MTINKQWVGEDKTVDFYWHCELVPIKIDREKLGISDLTDKECKPLLGEYPDKWGYHIFDYGNNKYLYISHNRSDDYKFDRLSKFNFVDPSEIKYEDYKLRFTAIKNIIENNNISKGNIVQRER